MLDSFEKLYIDMMTTLAVNQKTLFQHNGLQTGRDTSSYTTIRDRISNCAEDQLTERQVFLKVNAIYCYITTAICFCDDFIRHTDVITQLIKVIINQRNHINTEGAIYCFHFILGVSYQWGVQLSLVSNKLLVELFSSLLIMNHDIEQRYDFFYTQVLKCPHPHKDKDLFELNIDIINHINLAIQKSENHSATCYLYQHLNDNTQLRDWLIKHIDYNSPIVTTILCMLYNIITLSPTKSDALLVDIYSSPAMIKRSIECLHLVDELMSDNHDQMIIGFLKGAITYGEHYLHSTDYQKYKITITRLINKERGFLSNHSIEQLKPIAQAFDQARRECQGTSIDRTNYF